MGEDQSEITAVGSGGVSSGLASGVEDRPITRVLLVDDHEMVRSGLRAIIDRESDLTVVGEAETAAEAIASVEAGQPDLVIMDVRLPDRSGISACHEITRRFGDVKVLILTAYSSQIALDSAVDAGASGYVLKTVKTQEIVADIRRLIAGERVFDQVLGDSESRLASLTSQEAALADLLSEGLTNHEIAERMNLAEKTVKNYVSNVLTKMGMSRRSEAAAYVARLEAGSDAAPPESWEEDS